MGKLTREQMDQIEIIADRYFDMIYRIAFTYSKSRENAEDICQEVFERYMKKMPAFENEEHEKAWMIRVTINAAKNFLNTAWFRRITSLEDQKEPHAVFMEDWQKELFEEVMNLPKKYRIPLHLYYYEGYSVKEISELLNRKEGTVAVQLKRARTMLKEVL